MRYQSAHIWVPRIDKQLGSDTYPRSILCPRLRGDAFHCSQLMYAQRSGCLLRCSDLFLHLAKITASLRGAYNAEQYTHRPEHRPKTGNEHEDKYVLTLHADRKHHESMTALRNQYFPSHLNKLDAHIALFRALPGSHPPKIETDILAVTARETDFEIRASRPFMMGHGVGINAEVSGAHRVYRDLKKEWKSWLSCKHCVLPNGRSSLENIL